MSEYGQLDQADRKAAEVHTRAAFWNAIRAGVPRVMAARLAADARTAFVARRVRAPQVMFTCPVCRMTTWNRQDAQAGYCTRCHERTGA